MFLGDLVINFKYFAFMFKPDKYQREMDIKELQQAIFVFITKPRIIPLEKISKKITNSFEPISLSLSFIKCLNN